MSLESQPDHLSKSIGSVWQTQAPPEVDCGGHTSYFSTWETGNWRMKACLDSENKAGEGSRLVEGLSQKHEDLS